MQDASELEKTWRGLEAGAHPSYFLSWGWIENWLDSLPREERPQLQVLHAGAQPLAAGFVARRRMLHRHLLPSRTAFLNATGNARYDEVVIEHNGLVRAVPTATRRWLDALDEDWDELVMRSVDASELAGLDGEHYAVCIDRDVAAPFVDLTRVRETPGGYLALLSASTRAQVRRARRGVGAITVEHAADLPRATAIFDELVALHTASWRARGERGAFADPWFEAFHRNLLARRFASGEIDLVRVSAGGRTLGCLYNFVYRGRVLFYQSGLARDDDARVKPGFICHAAAIEDAARAGHAIYDFLAGDARYKRSLATGETRVLWARVQRPGLRFALEEYLRGWRRRASDARSRWLAPCSTSRV